MTFALSTDAIALVSEKVFITPTRLPRAAAPSGFVLFIFITDWYSDSKVTSVSVPRRSPTTPPTAAELCFASTEITLFAVSITPTFSILPSIAIPTTPPALTRFALPLIVMPPGLDSVPNVMCPTSFIRASAPAIAPTMPPKIELYCASALLSRDMVLSNS